MFFSFIKACESKNLLKQDFQVLERRPLNVSETVLQQNVRLAKNDIFGHLQVPLDTLDYVAGWQKLW